MHESRTLGPWLRRFLTEHIVTERNLAHNTQKSYRDTFALLLPFVGAKVRKPVDRLALQDLDARRVLQFLAHLEADRGCSVQTRNQRLTAVRAFTRFVASRDPAHLEWNSNIRAIALKKATPQPIGWLSKTEMKALLDVLDRRTPRGRRTSKTGRNSSTGSSTPCGAAKPSASSAANRSAASPSSPSTSPSPRACPACAASTPTSPDRC